MDSVVHSALEEICYGEDEGIHLSKLWRKLTTSIPSSLSLSPSVKQAVWENLVQVPGLKFQAACHDAVEDWSKCTVEECEQRNVTIVAPQPMRKSFQGIYEIESTLSHTQRLIIQKLTLARTNGIAQNELAKELLMPPNNLFYQLKTLETLGLIVRLPTIIRKKHQSSSNNRKEPKNDSVVHTNMLYLYRHGKHLGCQQRLEISKEEDDGNDFTNEIILEKEDVRVKDFLPALKDICDKLETSEGKVLVVSDIKRDLGYQCQGASGHRAWRHICHRLKDAQVIEDCCTMVNKKMVKCLRLLKSFSPSHFEPKVHGRGHDDVNMEQSMISVKRGQTTEQLVELPILRQIYDIIDAAGSKGLTNTEVCRGLGLCNKEYHKRYLNNRIFRFGLHSQLEFHNRCKIYRHFTAGNFNLEASNMSPAERKMVLQKVSEPNSLVLDPDNHENLSQPMPKQVVNTLCSNDKNVDKGKSNLVLQWNPQNSDAELCNGVPDEELLLVNKSAIDNDQLEKSPHVVVTPPSPRSQSYLRYPRLVMVREQRILKMLEEDKFLIAAELRRRLESLEKEKNTVMDRKTLKSSLIKLQENGHCKCIHFPVPLVTNCGRSKTRLVVLHPSLYNNITENNIATELLVQINDKLKDFEIKVHKPSCNRSVTVLDKVQRIPNSVRSDVQSSERADGMCTNGFVMVRTKLLHIYLWGWVSSSPDDGLLSSDHASGLKNPHSSCKFFELDVAIKSMPLELFLQVVGSSQKFEDMVEKCTNSGSEYNCLMDTRASGRLSRLIDILRRLKLIRLVSKVNENDSASSALATLTHALELKPYIEEPLSTIASCGFLFPDLRPNHRYDFVLRSRKDVDVYWDYLEFFYATAKPEAASHAFPGSAVHEVIHSRSWTSVREMTAGQRAEVLKRVGKVDSNKKLSFSECEKIAKDLSLTLAQDWKPFELHLLHKDLVELSLIELDLKKGFPIGACLQQGQIFIQSDLLVLRVYYDKRQHSRVSDAKGEKIQPIKGKHIISPCKRKRNLGGVSSNLVKAPLLTTSEDYGCHLERRDYIGDDMAFSEEEPESNEEDKEACTPLLHRSLSRLHPTRQKRFSWTEEADRKLVIEYSRHRADRGANSNRVNWASISNLPAHPDACRRRMSSLKSCDPFRKSLMQLCEKLAIRKYPERFQDKMLNRVVDFEKNVRWDDFDDNNIKAALDDALRTKRMAKLDTVKDTFSDQENEDSENCGGSEASSHKSSSRKLPKKYVKLLNEGTRVSEKLMHESVAIANASELFKLIFLSSSKASQVPEVLAKTLRRYSEHDLYSAFDYLREKKIVIGGSCNSPFGISHQFLQNISPPEFPKGTGKRADKFASWVNEREKNLMEEGIEVPSDLQFGETLTLCALVSSGELMIAPSLPEEGVGEAEDNRTLKRKFDSSEPDGEGICKKFKTSFAGESEITSRRPKGFPGIKICLHRETMSRLPAIVDDTLSGSKSDVNEHVREILDYGGSIHHVLNVSESPWEAMTSYAEYLMSSYSYEVNSSFLHPNLLKTLYSAIQKSGDRGLSMKEISKVLNIEEDENMLEIMVEVLEAFGQALKVNAYNSIHVVDPLYRSKYFLTSVAVATLKDRQTGNEDEHMPVNLDNLINNGGGADDVHRVTILNLPEDVGGHSEFLRESKITGYKHDSEVAPSHVNRRVEKTCKPLLPWMNGDGTINDAVYQRLISCVLRIVMQNPGILEDGVIKKMNCMNPQSCRRLLEIMIMDNHIITRKMQQRTSTQPPSILGSLLGDNFRKSKFVCRVHLFANPKSTSFL